MQKKVLIGILLLALAAGIASAIVFLSRNCFIKTDGQTFVGAWGQEYRIKGMAFTNDVYDNPSVPQVAHHTEESYRVLHDMGMNTVRFYLNYGLFEDDAAPGEYKEEGFQWLDKNIEWAKKNGIRLIFNIHYPQGGYQAQAGGSLLWTEPANQERLTALWKEIAKRYADEPWVLGYGILNEPIVPQLDSLEQSLEPARAFMQQTIDEIRTVDKKHVIFVERVQGVTQAPEQTWQFPFQDERNFVTVQDDNYAYELHFYLPLEFTHQGIPWYEEQSGNTESVAWNSENKVYGRLDKAYLEKELTPYLNIAEQRNVPLYIGEMGTSNASMENGLGGEEWLLDMLALCSEYSLGYTVHSFHEENGFGLYTDSVGQYPKTINRKMYETLR